MSNSVDSDQPCFTKVHNWLARLRFRDRARPEPKWPLVTRLLGEPPVGSGNWRWPIAELALEAQGKLEAAQKAFGEYLAISRRLAEQGPG
jgi:hypothetical protein